MRCTLVLAMVFAACNASVHGDAIDAASDDDTPGPVGPDGDVPDAAVDAAVDAAPDARACAGGDAATVAPDGTCFLLFTTPVNRATARTTCAQNGAHLARLDSAELASAAVAFVGNRDVAFGLNDEAVESTFVWESGSPSLGFSNFAPNEPNNGGGAFQEDCAIIPGTRLDKRWDDRPCAAGAPAGETFAVLCQF